MQPLKNVELLRKESVALPNGETLIVDDQLLNELVETYDPINNHESPVVLGHDSDDGMLPKHDGAPAHGWLLKLRRIKDSLFGDFEISDELANWIDEKLYKKLSISFYTADSDLSPGKGKAYMRHVAMLGASPPVVKGLKAYSLSEQGTIMTQAINMQEPVVEATDSTDVLAQNAANWLRLILADGDKGFKDDIMSFNPEPSAENNYLADAEAGIIKGQFLNDQGIEFDFIIEKTGEGFSREFKPANAAKAEEQQKAATGEGPTADELTEQVLETEPEATQETEQMTELEMTEQKALETDFDKTEQETLNEDNLENQEVVSEEEIVEAQAELNNEIADEVEGESAPIVDDEELGEIKKLTEQLKELQEQNRKLKEMQKEKEMGELRKFSEGLFASGKLAEGFVKQEEVTNFMVALSEAQPITLSEGSEASSPLAWFQSFMDKLPNTVALGELAANIKDASPATDLYSPANTIIDDESAKLHGKVISFCEANNLDIKQPLVYRTALKEVIKNNGVK